MSASVPLDVNAFVGAYPFRHVPHPDPDALLRVMARERILRAWVGHLATPWHRDVRHGNAALFEVLAPHADVLDAVPAIRPDWPRWQAELATLVDRGVPAIRAYPPQWGIAADGVPMRRLASACAEAGVALVLTVRFEDVRQRHHLDQAGDLAGAGLRGLVRATEGLRLVVTAAGRALIEEVHWGLTPAERARISWDISWIWGPPEDDLAHLLRTIGAPRFVFGTMWPLRLAQVPRASLTLLPPDVATPTLGNLL